MFAVGDRVWWQLTATTIARGTVRVAEERPGVQPDGETDLVYLDPGQARRIIPDDDGLYPDIPDSEYHADLASLSSSGARALVSACPAKFDHLRREPPNPTPEYDFGHAWHKYVLGEGAEIVEVPYEQWHGKDARAIRDRAWAQHKVPLRPSAIAKAREMVAALRRHPLASRLLFELPGISELSGYWTDPVTGVRLRYRPDRLVELSDGRIVCVDCKSTTDASPRHFAGQSAGLGYYQQDAWYRDGLAANSITDTPAFLFVVQEKTPPYVVSVLQHHPDDVQRGRELNRAAVDLYAQCTAENHWPGYGSGVHTVSLPGWHSAQHEPRMQALTNLIAA
ncbi:PD-(D/E)XK nuclease-like domain-containing protein [Mycobacterium canetti]|uniref:PD-(D/E)XK nuclease-like domain-containing protein n=1 Tax=Mycobacterium canetti TaxID=78331 RepID=UPI001ED9852C|nr:PD-(D/E)XK nuclease-like domain-containing protein [Mycobacterium canetti]